MRKPFFRKLGKLEKYTEVGSINEWGTFQIVLEKIWTETKTQEYLIRGELLFTFPSPHQKIPYLMHKHWWLTVHPLMPFCWIEDMFITWVTVPQQQCLMTKLELHPSLWHRLMMVRHGAAYKVLGVELSTWNAHCTSWLSCIYFPDVKKET